MATVAVVVLHFGSQDYVTCELKKVQTVSSEGGLIASAVVWAVDQVKLQQSPPMCITLSIQYLLNQPLPSLGSG